MRDHACICMRVQRLDVVADRQQGSRTLPGDDGSSATYGRFV